MRDLIQRLYQSDHAQRQFSRSIVSLAAWQRLCCITSTNQIHGGVAVRGEGSPLVPPPPPFSDTRCEPSYSDCTSWSTLSAHTIVPLILCKHHIRVHADVTCPGEVAVRYEGGPPVLPPSSVPRCETTAPVGVHVHASHTQRQIAAFSSDGPAMRVFRCAVCAVCFST